MSSADEVALSLARRPPMFWPRILLVIAIAGAILADAVVMPQPWREIEHRLLLTVRWPALAVLVVLLAVGLTALVVTSRTVGKLPVVPAEEPRLSPPRLTPARSEVKVVTLIGLEPDCGVTTLTFNLAVLLAVLGEKPGSDHGPQPVRTACLLSESRLSAALGLTSAAVEQQLGERPWDVRPEVVNLSVRHPSGCELFCLRGGGRAADAVDRLVQQLRRHYDAVLVDGAISTPERNSVLDPSDLFLLVARPQFGSVEPAGRWIERVWGTRRETSTVIVVNRVPAWPPPPRELVLAFHHLVLLPEESRVAAVDRRGLPWSLYDQLAVASQLTRLARRVFPRLISGSSHAA